MFDLPMSEKKIDNPTFLMITGIGVIFILLSILSMILGVYFDSPIFLLAGIPILLTFISFSRLILQFKSLDMDMHFSISALQIKAKQFLPVHLIVKSNKNIIGLLKIEISDGLFPVITPETAVINTKKKIGYTFLFYAPKRGKEKIYRISLKFSGLVGLFYIEKRVGINQEIIVLPEPQRVTIPFTHRQKILDQLIAEISTPIKGRGSEFLSLKDFSYGDEVRHIHWKATAKFGKLISKEFEDPKMLRFLIVIDTSLFMVGPKLEFALSAAVELASVIRKSNHSLSIITHGEKITKIMKLGSSISALRKLSLELHKVKAEGTGFDYNSLQKYIVDNKLIGSVIILISDLEQDKKIIANGMTALKPYYQTLFYFACFGPGFGTLALKNVVDVSVYNQDQLFYRREIIEPRLKSIYDNRAKEYRSIIPGNHSKFRVINDYNTNILLEIETLLSLYPKQRKIASTIGNQ